MDNVTMVDMNLNNRYHGSKKCYHSNILRRKERFLKMFDFLGDVLSSEAGNSIPLLAIIYAALSSMNSVGVSVYQEQLFKVNMLSFI